MDFEKEVATHKDAVYRQMVRVCGNAEDAEDALAEALLSGFKAAHQLRDPSAFRSWLVMIGKRACVKIRMKPGLSTETSLEALEEAGVPMPSSADPNANFEIETTEMHECVIGVIEKLPEIYQVVYMMREIEGQSAEETANSLKISVSAVKSRLHRARVLVREALDKSLCRQLGPENLS